MEIPFNLIWVIRPLTQCLLSGGSIKPRQMELTLEGPGAAARFQVELGYCENCGCWYGLFDGLERMLDEAGWDSDEVTAFLIRNRVLSVGGWLGEDTSILSWEQLIALLKEMVSEPSGPPPDDATVRALPELRETWEVGIRVARWITEQEGQPVLSYIAAVLDGELVLRQFSLKAGARQGVTELATLILEAAARPRDPAQPGRPLNVLVADRSLAKPLASHLAGTGITVASGLTPNVDAILGHMMEEMRQEEQPPYFIDYDDESVRSFFQTAARFYRARPWERFDGTRYLGYRIGNGPWQYASVMGQAGEEPGLSIFDDWLQLCRFVYNQPELAPTHHRDDQLWPLRAAGALEGVTIAPLHFLHPEDADRILRLKIRPLLGREYPLPHRYVAGGLERPHLALPHYRILMSALLEALAPRRTGEVTSLRRTIHVDETTVRLVYPANARAEFEEGAAAFRLVVEGAGSTFARPLLPQGTRIEVDAPANARVDDVSHAIKRASGSGLRVDAFLDGEYILWDNGIGRLATTPRIAHLAAAGDLQVSLQGNRHRAHVMRQLGPLPPEIQVRIVR